MNGVAEASSGDIFLVAGEASGDLHASGLVREFKQLRPDLHFFGCGGDRLAQEGCEILYHIRDLSFLGFAEVLRHLPFIQKMMNRLLAECRERQPRAVVLVDYPGFNLRFAARLKKLPETRQIPILYYISPQVWAWYSSRVPSIARLVDRMAVIFDFEVPIYAQVGLQADFVGHPLLDIVRPALNREAFRATLGVSPTDQMIALAPGSRYQEVSRLFPLFLRTCRLLRRDFPQLRVVVGCSPTLKPDVYQEMLDAQGWQKPDINLIENQTYDVLAHSDVALVASGTVTLETAILGTPLVMAYRVSPLTYWIGRTLVKIPNIALVNVVAGEKVAPEFVQHQATPQHLAGELADLLHRPERRREMIAQLMRVASKLGTPGASLRVANLLQELINYTNARK